MRTLDEFQEKKQTILDAYDDVLSSEFVSSLGTDTDKLEDKRKQLKDEKFVVAVCGQMNAGKSTLLNALVFRKPVLPSEVTVMTATNTILRYGEEPRFEATFYSSTEWEKFVSRVRTDEDARTRLEESLEKAANAGVYKDECVRSSSHTVRSGDLDKLTAFAGTVENGGLYTPFVKSLDIYYDHPWLEDVEIADTPGVNDPNPIREDITKDWIHRAHAVVYVTYAGKAMNKSDIDFIDEYLMHVPSRCRLISVNKIDVPEDRTSVEEWINNLRDEKRFRVLLGDEESNYFVCALGGLIDRMERDGLKLSSELEEEAERLAMQGFLDSECHQIEAFQESVGERLIQTRGESLLDAHVTYLDSVFELRERELRDHRAEQRELLDTLSKKQHELEAEIEKIESARVRISQLGERQKSDFQDKYSDQMSKLKSELNGINNGVIQEINSTLSRVKDHKIFYDVGWEITSLLEDQEQKIYGNIKRCRERLQESLNDELDKVRRELEAAMEEEDVLTMSRISTIIDFSAYRHAQTLRSKIDKKIDKIDIKRVVKNKANIVQRILNTEKGINRIREGLVNDLSGAVRKGFKKVEANIEEQLREEFEKAPESIHKEINRALSKKQRQLEQLKKDKDSMKERRKEVKGKLEDVQISIDRVSSFRQNMLCDV